MDNKRKLRIWLTTDWEANHLQRETDQLGRMFSLAEYLAYEGHEVTLWYSTFSHPDKKYLYTKDTCVIGKEKERIMLLHSPISYKSNMSPSRVLYYSFLAKRMKKVIKDKNQFPSPDLILCSYPTEPICRVALAYGKRNHVPVILDARDQWPDIFERAFPSSLKFVAKVALLPMKHRASLAFRRADAICSMSPIMLKWALHYAKREQNALDRYIFIGCKRTDISTERMSRATEEWKNLGVTENSFNVCLFSTLSKTALDVDTVIEAVKLANEEKHNVHLIIGGHGDDGERLNDISKNYDFIHFMGWMDNIQMSSAMTLCKVGIVCYRNTKDFRDGWGNKIGQYLSYGLPLLTSAEGFAKTYVEQHNCGIAYKEGNTRGLADVLEELSTNEDRMNELSRQAQLRYDLDFASRVVFDKFSEMIDEVIKDKEEL